MWLNRRGLLGQGAEIGCSHCGHAKQLFSNWQGALMWLVDPWSKQDVSIYREATNREADFNAWYSECAEWASTTNSRVAMLRLLSVDAAMRFGNNVLDWVYLDGNHSYEAVSADLRAWWPKVKSGGLFGGHDYGNDTTTLGWDCEVQRALDDWLPAVGVGLHLTPCSSWWIMKP